VRYIDTAGVIRTLITGGDVSGTLLVSGLVKYVAPIPGSVDVYVLTHISNFNRYAILRVAPDGSFTVVAGGGADATGEGVGALSADLELGPVAALGDGSIVIAERSRDRLRRITGGVITTIAGVSGMGGFMGDGTTAGSARVDQPEGVEAWRGVAHPLHRHPQRTGARHLVKGCSWRARPRRGAHGGRASVAAHHP
jgi:hypothetical protein